MLNPRSPQLAWAARQPPHVTASRGIAIVRSGFANIKRLLRFRQLLGSIDFAGVNSCHMPKRGRYAVRTGSVAASGSSSASIVFASSAIAVARSERSPAGWRIPGDADPALQQKRVCSKRCWTTGIDRPGNVGYR
jgi:hypothetical protein